MSHWMDTDRFDDDSDIEAAPQRTWNPLTLIAAQLQTRYSPMPREIVREAVCANSDMDPALWDAPPTTEELAELGEAAPDPRVSARRQRTAASICASCPVRQLCLDDARGNPDTRGIRGGVLFAGPLGGEHIEHNLIDLAARGHLQNSPAGRGRTAASAVA